MTDAQRPATAQDALTSGRPRVLAVIQCAMDLEAAPFLGGLSGAHPPRQLGDPNRHMQSFAFGALDGAPVLVVTAGIGLANAASATARALTLVDPDVVISAGTAGGLHPDSEVGDLVAGVTTTYASADATAFGYARGQIPQMPEQYESGERARQWVAALAGGVARASRPVRVGQVVSADSFVTASTVERVRQQFPDALATDMETAALAQVAWSSGVEWVALRAVSDLCGPRADQDFHMDADRAARLSYDAVRAFVSELPA